MTNKPISKSSVQMNATAASERGEKNITKLPSGSELAASMCEKTAAIIRQRGKTHGDAFENLRDIANRWSDELGLEDGEKLTVGDVCRMMIQAKLSRASCGDANEIDHPADIAGYAAIWAAWLQKYAAKKSGAV